MENKIITVKPDEITTIEVSGAFLSRLNNMLVRLLTEYGPEESLLLMTEIRQKIEGVTTEISPKAADLMALISLINTIETSFRLQGKTTIENIDPQAGEQKQHNQQTQEM